MSKQYTQQPFVPNWYQNLNLNDMCAGLNDEATKSWLKKLWDGTANGYEWLKTKAINFDDWLWFGENTGFNWMNNKFQNSKAWLNSQIQPITSHRGTKYIVTPAVIALTIYLLKLKLERELELMERENEIKEKKRREYLNRKKL